MAAGSIIETNRCEVVVRVSGDRLLATVTCSYETVCQDQALDAIMAELERLKITAPVDRDSLNEAINKARLDKTGLALYEVAKGIQPTESQDGTLEWTHDYFADGYFVDPITQTVDFHRRAAAPSVKAEELVVTVHPPKQGIDGHDVYGNVLPARKPQAALIKAGKCVSWDEAAGGFRATCSGRLKFAGNLLEIQNLYEISGDIGPENGNVNHIGSVVIKGEIASEYSVEATGDIDVAGLIGAAEIRCGGNLTAKNGIRGSLNKMIEVKGTLTTKYLEYTTVHSEGDIIVETEIVDSSIRTTGKVICAGRVQGGDIMAANGMTLGSVGSKVEARTVLTAGIDYRVLFAMRAATEEGKKLKVELTKLESETKRLVMYGSRMSHKQREVLTELDFKLFELKEKYKVNTELRQSLATKLHANKHAVIIVEDQLNAGTVLRVTDAQYEVRQPLLGPLQAAVNPVTGELSLASVEHQKKE